MILPLRLTNGRVMSVDMSLSVVWMVIALYADILNTKQLNTAGNFMALHLIGSSRVLFAFASAVYSALRFISKVAVGFMSSGLIVLMLLLYYTNGSHEWRVTSLYHLPLYCWATIFRPTFTSWPT